MKPIRVLQLQSKYAAGVSHVASMIAGALPSDRYQVTNAYLQGKPETGSEAVKLFNFSNGECRGFRFKVKRELEAYCREQGFDIVIAHRFKAISALMPVVKKLQIPTAIAVVHGIGDYDRWYRKLLARHYFKSRWKVVAVSNYVESYLARADKVFTPSLVSVIPNAVDVETLQRSFLSRQQARTELGLSESDFVFGAHGRLAKVKGYDYLLEAFAPVAKMHPQAKLVLMGGGPLYDSLKVRAEELGIARQLVLTGYRAGASRYLKALDIFVMPSRSEGLSIALLEAMAAALPLVVSEVESIKFVVEGTSKPLPIADLEAWERGLLIRAGLDSEEKTAQGELSFSCVVNRFSSKIFSQNYRQLVQS